MRDLDAQRMDDEWQKRMESLRTRDVDDLRAEEVSMREREDALMRGIGNVTEMLERMSDVEKYKLAIRLSEKVFSMLDRMDINRVIREKEKCNE